MRRHPILALLLAGSLLLSPFLFAPRAAAQYDPVVVNSDADPGDGVCDANECTLREALARSYVTITFHIPGPGPHTIRPLSPLPRAYFVSIDGYSQPGAVRNTNPITTGLNSILMIELDGSLAGANARGLDVLPGYVTGLVINRFSGDGIEAGSETSSIHGNYIGTDVTGKVDLGNGGNGIYDLGDASIKGNLIAGNGKDGIAGAGMMDVYDNLIGTDVTGKRPLGNDGAGARYYYGHGAMIVRNVIAANAAGIVVNDTTSIDSNLIGGAGPDDVLGNRGDGVTVDCEPGGCGAWITHNQIAGNGGNGVWADCSDVSCAVEVKSSRIEGNAANGIQLIEAPGTVEDDLITGNGGAGIAIEGSGGVYRVSSLQRNRISGNGGLGIDLGVDGPTANDPGDADTGPNDLQNYPRIEAVERSATTVAGGLLKSAPLGRYALEFFSSRHCDPSGFGEGETPLISLEVATDATGSVRFAAPIAAAFDQPYVTATATRIEGGTSEFSNCMPVVIKANRFAIPTGQRSSYNARDPRAPKGVVTVETTYHNPYAVAVQDVYFKVVRLEYKDAKLPGGGLMVLNAAGGPTHTDARIVVPGGIPANGVVTVRYEIGLPIKAPFRLAADAYGRIGAGPLAVRDMVEADAPGWEVEIGDARADTIYLPALGR